MMDNKRLIILALKTICEKGYNVSNFTSKTCNEQLSITYDACLQVKQKIFQLQYSEIKPSSTFLKVCG
jgi:hypothetical protein